MLNPHLDVGGWNFLFAGTMLMAAYYAVKLLHSDGHLSLIRIKQEGPLRMLFGFSLVCLGGAIRVGGWLPWRSMLYAQSEWAAWYQGLSNIWTGTGVLLAVIGLGLIMHKGAIRMTLIAAGLYLTGYLGTWLFALLF